MDELRLRGHVAGVLHGVGRVDDVHLQRRHKGSLNVSADGVDMHLTSTTEVGPGPVLAGREKNRSGQGGCCDHVMLSHSQEHSAVGIAHFYCI